MTRTMDKYVSFYYETAGIPESVNLDPSTTALLVVDMQNEFVLKDFGEAAEFKERGEYDRWAPYFNRLHDVVIPNIKKLMDFFRKNNLEVTHGRIACLKENGNDRCLVQKKPGWNEMLMHINSFAAEIVDELKPIKDEIVVNKTTDSVVSGTNYSILLKNMGVKTVVVTGIVTDQCISSTVRSLADEGFEVIVVENCCAAASQELHETELKILNIIYCYVMNTDEVIGLIKKELKK